MAEEDPRGARSSRRWLGLAIGSLLLAGSFALMLVVARVPPLSNWVTSPEFFKRALVVHVDLSMVVWFYAFIAGLFALLPVRPGARSMSGLGFVVAASGMALVVAAIFVPDVQPVLSNYVPALDHPLFLAGISAFFVGVGLSFVDVRMLPRLEVPDGESVVPEAARPGLRTAALAYLMALLTFAASASSLPEGLPAQGRFELLFWGGGHVLQVASEAAMLSVWLMLLTPALGRSPVSRGTASLLFGVLLLPALAGPVLALQGIQRGAIHEAFTRMMEWGIFPVVVVFLALCLKALVSETREGGVRLGDPRVLGFLASATLTLTGFVLGALIQGSNTMVPGHYHANIGAVTAAFMTVTWPVLRALGVQSPGGRLERASRWQPLLFGGGQFVFALGFALAGAQGMARKAYGAEQHIRTATEWVGLVVMGIGGLVAITGGVLFLVIVLRSVAKAAHRPTFTLRRDLWPAASTRSNH